MTDFWGMAPIQNWLHLKFRGPQEWLLWNFRVKRSAQERKPWKWELWEVLFIGGSAWPKQIHPLVLPTPYFFSWDSYVWYFLSTSLDKWKTFKLWISIMSELLPAAGCSGNVKKRQWQPSLTCLYCPLQPYLTDVALFTCNQLQSEVSHQKSQK